MNPTLVILLTLLARTLARCPSESVIHPCKCMDVQDTSYVKCEHSDTFGDLQAVFDKSLDYPFDVLTLFGFAIPHLNSTWISSKKVKALFLEEMTMYDFLDDTHLTVPSVVSIVVGKSKVLRRVRWEDFRAFTGLATLAIADTEVKKLGTEFRDNVSSGLRVLSVMRARVRVLGDGVFGGKTQLDSVTFQSNRIKVLKRSFFEDQKDVLAFVDFSFNPIESIPDDLFDGMHSLKIVTFQGTHLKTLSKSLNFGNYLNLMDTPLVCDCEMSWIPEKIDSFVLDGSCELPPDLKSKQLKYLTKRDFSACDSA